MQGPVDTSCHAIIDEEETREPLIPSIDDEQGEKKNGEWEGEDDGQIKRLPECVWLD